MPRRKWSDEVAEDNEIRRTAAESLGLDKSQPEEPDSMLIQAGWLGDQQRLTERYGFKHKEHWYVVEETSLWNALQKIKARLGVKSATEMEWLFQDQKWPLNADFHGRKSPNIFSMIL